MRKKIVIATTALAVILLFMFFQASVWSAKRIPQQERAGEQPSLSAEELTSLVDVLRDEKLRKTEPDKVAAALARLGAAHAVEAIPDMINLLTFERPIRGEKRTKDGGIVGGLYPRTLGYPA